MSRSILTGLHRQDQNLYTECPCLVGYYFYWIHSDDWKSGHRHWTCFIVDLHYRWRGVIFHSYVEVSIAMAVFPNRWFISENPINMDDFGVPLFWETSMSVYLKGQPPCHFVGWWKPRLAARSDDRWMVEVLLTFGADPEMKNINNEARWKKSIGRLFMGLPWKKVWKKDWVDDKDIWFTGCWLGGS